MFALKKKRRRKKTKQNINKKCKCVRMKEHNDIALTTFCHINTGTKLSDSTVACHI